MALLLGFFLEVLLSIFLGYFLASDIPGLKSKYRGASIRPNRPRCIACKRSSASINFESHPKFRRRPLKSGRAAHIGFAAADHAFRRGLGVRLGRTRTGAIFEVRKFGGFAPCEP